VVFIPLEHDRFKGIMLQLFYEGDARLAPRQMRGPGPRLDHVLLDHAHLLFTLRQCFLLRNNIERSAFTLHYYYANIAYF
jgi:hypothetical protein